MFGVTGLHPCGEKADAMLFPQCAGRLWTFALRWRGGYGYSCTAVPNMVEPALVFRPRLKLPVLSLESGSISSPVCASCHVAINPPTHPSYRLKEKMACPVPSVRELRYGRFWSVVFVPAGVGVHATLHVAKILAECHGDWPHATAPSRPRRVWILTCIATGGARGGV